VLIFLYQYKVHVLRLIVEHNIQQMSPATLLSLGGRQCMHFKSCTLVGIPHILYHTTPCVFSKRIKVFITLKVQGNLYWLLSFKSHDHVVQIILCINWTCHHATTLSIIYNGY